MTLRRATNADAAAVGRIHVESWNVAYRGIMPDEVIAKTDLAYRTQFWAERIADPDWPVFVMEEQGECVAFCQMIPTRDPDDNAAHIGHITSLHVLPWLRGQGHGRLLMDHVRQFCRQFVRQAFEVCLEVLVIVAHSQSSTLKFGSS